MNGRRAVPQVSRSPIRLGLSLLFSGNPVASRVALRMVIGLALLPLDSLLAGEERRLEEASHPPDRPVLLVCGPPRSGTTLVATYLIDALDVCYVNNLAEMFPSAPLAVNRIWGARSNDGAGDYQSFYGRTRRLRGVNDGVAIWDRWAGADRKRIPVELLPGAERSMPAFFGAMERVYGKPVVNKQNRLGMFAHLVAPVLPTARFVVIEREPVWLAQSLYVARQAIARDLSFPYGTEHPDRFPNDPVADVCAQTMFLLKETEASIARVPADRVFRVPYEAFCRRPAALLEDLERSLDGAMPPRRGGVRPPPADFSASHSRRVPLEVFERMERLLDV